MKSAAALVLGAVVALGVQDPTPAAACSLPRYVDTPQNGATDVPLNLTEVIAPWMANQPFSLWNRVTGVEVPTTLVVEWGLTRIHVLESLEPGTRHELRFGSTGDGPVYSAFTTGTAADTTLPGPVAVTGLAMAYATLGSGTSCGDHVIDVAGTITGLSGEPFIGVRVTGAGLVQERLLPITTAYPGGFELLRWPQSQTNIDLLPGETYNVEIWARDFAGNVGPSYIEHVVVRDCGMVPSTSDFALVNCPLVPDPEPEPPCADCDPGGCSVDGRSRWASTALLALLLGLGRRRRGSVR